LTPGLLPTGLRDRLPPQAEAASRLLHRVIVAIGRHGYDRVSPPLVEYEEELVGRLKSARRQDLFRFVDPVSQRALALRPDITGQVGRIAATRMGHLPRPLRLAYGGAVLKLRATQLRPERELTQAGAELIGSDHITAVIEVLRVAIEALEAAGVGDITVDLTLPDLVETLAAGPIPVTPDRLPAIRDALDAKDAGALGPLGAAAFLPLVEAGRADRVRPRPPRRPRAGARALRAAGGGRRDRRHVRRRVSFTLDPTSATASNIRAGSASPCSRTASPARSAAAAAMRSCMRTGREEPAVGFSLYIDPLVDAGLGQEPSRRLFVPLGADPEAARALRREGWTTIAALTDADAPIGCTHRLDGSTPVDI
jgi:ATP phosphoribosyltransferase regulatory subunit